MKITIKNSFKRLFKFCKSKIHPDTTFRKLTGWRPAIIGHEVLNKDWWVCKQNDHSVRDETRPFSCSPALPQPASIRFAAKYLFLSTSVWIRMVESAFVFKLARLRKQSMVDSWDRVQSNFLCSHLQIKVIDKKLFSNSSRCNHTSHEWNLADETSCNAIM